VKRLACLLFLVPTLSLAASAPIGASTNEPPIAPAPAVRVVSFLTDEALCRAQRPAHLTATIENDTPTAATVQPKLDLPAGVRLVEGDASPSLTLDPGRQEKVSWTIESDAMTTAALGLTVEENGRTVAASSASVNFLQPVAMQHPDYIPAPQPVHTDLLVGAIDWPGWQNFTDAQLRAVGQKPSAPGAALDQKWPWTAVMKHPERLSALGVYDQRNPEVADWETKWALEHGISFFVYCWTRLGDGDPVKLRVGGVNDGLLKSRFQNRIKFAIQWDLSKYWPSVTGEKDMTDNLIPYCMNTYFKRPNYLVIDHKPVFFIYSPLVLVQQLKGMAPAQKLLVDLRRACVQAGFAGIYLAGEYRGHDPRVLAQMKQLGLDETFAYCWNIPKSPTPAEAITLQEHDIETTENFHILPELVTLSEGWSGWHDEGSIWRLPPTDYEKLLEWGKQYVSHLPPDQLGHKMVLLDNWNEFGEGHYIAPHRQYGFGYLDAVRQVFSDAPGPHTDLIPQDIGRGPYDTVPVSSNP
jgi:hypothetical protein